MDRAKYVAFVSNLLRWLMVICPSATRVFCKNKKKIKIILSFTFYQHRWKFFFCQVFLCYECTLNSHSRMLNRDTSFCVTSWTTCGRLVAGSKWRYWFVLQLVLISFIIYVCRLCRQRQISQNGAISLLSVATSADWAPIKIYNRMEQLTKASTYLFSLLKTSNWPPGVLCCL